jgi:hypothetical protein
MAESPIYQAFKRVNCTQLILWVQLPASKALLSKVRSCLGGRRRNLPYDFAATYPGEGKEKVGAHASLMRGPHKDLALVVRWFAAEEGPPTEFGRFSDLVSCAREYFPEREAFVVAVFSYDKEEVASLFKPIYLVDQPVIFDEITGITGVKRSPEGKMVYELEMSFGGKRVNHVVKFTQSLRLSEDSPLPILEAASKISMLALRPKEGR